MHVMDTVLSSLQWPCRRGSQGWSVLWVISLLQASDWARERQHHTQQQEWVLWEKMVVSGIFLIYPCFFLLQFWESGLASLLNKHSVTAPQPAPSLCSQAWVTWPYPSQIPNVYFMDMTVYHEYFSVSISKLLSYPFLFLKYFMNMDALPHIYLWTA